MARRRPAGTLDKALAAPPLLEEAPAVAKLPLVETPVQLTARHRELLREFESISAQDSARHNPRAKGWFDKVKEFFEG